MVSGEGKMLFPFTPRHLRPFFRHRGEGSEGKKHDLHVVTRAYARERFVSVLFAHPFSRFFRTTFWKMRLQGDFSKRLPQNIGHFPENIGHKIYNLRLSRLISFVCFVETPIRDKELLFFALK